MRRPIKRRAVLGDLVRSKRGQRDYRVTEVCKDVWDRRVVWYGVESVENGLPNTFRPEEVETLSAK